MKSIRFTLAILFLAASSFVGTTWATSFSNDQSDLWWNANENGWGIQFVQRGSTIFATMFVYDCQWQPDVVRRGDARVEAKRRAYLYR